MPLDYDIDVQLKELTEISGEYLEWFLELTGRVVFPKNKDAKEFKRPESFVAWIQDVKERKKASERAIESLERRHKDLITIADSLINESLKSGKPLTPEHYDELAKAFEIFIDRIRRFEKDLILDETGVDALTGLRTPAIMKRDLKREMERLARQGRPFSIALVRIDHFEDIEKSLGEDADKYIQTIAQLIKKSVRAFDDAYRTERDEFLLSLKQADVSGGVKALERLKEFLEESQTKVDLGDKKIALSLSCCVAEPVAHDDLDLLLDNLKHDLDTIEIEGDAVLEYFELSPLQRYASEH